MLWILIILSRGTFLPTTFASHAGEMRNPLIICLFTAPLQSLFGHSSFFSFLLVLLFVLFLLLLWLWYLNVDRVLVRAKFFEKWSLWQSSGLYGWSVTEEFFLMQICISRDFNSQDQIYLIQWSLDSSSFLGFHVRLLNDSWKDLTWTARPVTHWVWFLFLLVLLSLDLTKCFLLSFQINKYNMQCNLNKNMQTSFKAIN